MAPERIYRCISTGRFNSISNCIENGSPDVSSALPGVTPPTICVPYAIACSEWNVPFLPVKPWQITLVSLLIRILMLNLLPRQPLFGQLQ